MPPQERVFESTWKPYQRMKKHRQKEWRTKTDRGGTAAFCDCQDHLFLITMCFLPVAPFDPSERVFSVFLNPNSPLGWSAASIFLSPYNSFEGRVYQTTFDHKPIKSTKAWVGPYCFR